MVASQDRDDEVIIADFGLSKFAAPQEVMKLPCGTLAYVAPEVLQLEGYGKEVDIWSIGVIMYVLLRGRLPFDGKKKSQVVAKTLAGKLHFEGDPVWDSVSQEGKDLIQGLLKVNPVERLTIEQALQHNWFSMQISEPVPSTTRSKSPSISADQAPGTPSMSADGRKRKSIIRKRPDIAIEPLKTEEETKSSPTPEEDLLEISPDSRMSIIPESPIITKPDPELKEPSAEEDKEAFMKILSNHPRASKVE
jgi:serine/threonine protein kinase